MPTWSLEVEWSAGTWTNEGARVLSARTSCGFWLGDLVADVGRGEFVLANHDRRFSPDNSSSPLYGLLLPRKQLRLKAGSTVVWRGYIERLLPTAGEWGRDRCTVIAVDGLALLDQARVSEAHEDSKAVDDAVAALVASSYTPAATSYADNGDELSHYGRSWQPERTTVRDAIREVCATVYGRFWVARDGTATYWSRNELQDGSASAALTLSGSEPVTGMELGIDVARVINRAQVTVFPVETVSVEQTIWESQTVLRVGPGETRTIYALYRDSSGERCGAVDVVTPVATTDYTVNERRDGTGVDYTGTSWFALSGTAEATRLALTLSNTASGPLYVTALKVRGKPIVTYDPVTVVHEDTSSQAAYQVRERALQLTMQEDDNLAQSYAEYLVGRYATPALAAKTLTIRDQDTINGVGVFSLDVFDKIVISDGQSGLSSAGHWITGLELEIGSQGWTLGAQLERADDTPYWVLGDTGLGELGDATRLGF